VVLKTLSIALLLLIAAPSLRAQKSVQQQLEFSGSVRSISIEIQQIDATGSAGPRRLVQMLVFDEKGNVLHQEMYNQADGSLKWKSNWGHNYDEQGREVKTHFYDAHGTLTNTGAIAYDDQGRRAKITQVNPDGSMNHFRMLSYDEGDQIREKFFSPDGTPRQEVTRRFDVRGWLTEEISTDPDGSIRQKNIFTYDEHGNETCWIVEMRGASRELRFNRSYTYDVRGNVSERINYSADGSVVSKETFAYEFDDHGNWIKRTSSQQSINGDSRSFNTEITYRTIKYF